MIAQGTDGCSRGSLMEGVMAGEDMLNFVDLARSAIERCPALLDWIRDWTQISDLEPLTPEGWFEEGHGISGGEKDAKGVWIPEHCEGGKAFLWTPPPAVADAMLEELLKARHKRTDTYHVVAIPRLMLPRWRRLFNKVCDFTFEVSPGATFWPETMFEPLWVGVILPFLHTTGRGALSAPQSWWKWESDCVKCSRPVKSMQGIFCGNFGVSRDGFPTCRSAWHPECYTCLGEGVFPMRRVVDEDGNPWHNDERRIKDLNTGVAGAHCCIPFQCEDCWIRNLEYCNPCRLDGMYLMSIRRANLDAMNGKARSTINGHRFRTQRLVNNSVRINKTPSLAPRGPFLLCDQVAMGLAVDINQESLVARRRNEPTVQAETL